MSEAATNTPPAEIEWDEKQREAIDACCDVSNRIVCVSGPAGTGKTLLIKEINKRLCEAGYVTQNCAPTGKAAKRVKESTGYSASTNHRMLGYGMPIEIEEEDEISGKITKVQISTGSRFGPGKTERYLPFDVVACDEYMMVNSTINREIIDALKPGARLLAFGDENQLRPIEEGRRDFNAPEPPAPFQNMLNNKGLKGIRLERLHRTGEGSGIASNAKGFLRGAYPERTHDFDVKMTASEDKSHPKSPVRMLEDHVLEAMDNGIRYDQTNAQIITPQNKTWVGAVALNAMLSQIFWDRTKPYMDLERKRAYGTEAKKDPGFLRVQVGSKVVYTANIYDLGDGAFVFNGEVGIITDLEHEYGNVTIDFGDRVVCIPPVVTLETDRGVSEFDPRQHIELAYAMTTHKMQGSECAHITVMLNRSMSFSHNRRNLYTAVTRAREHCTIITDQMGLSKSLRSPG